MLLADAVPEEGLKPLYLLLGSVVLMQLVRWGFDFVRWLGSRTVDREDKDKEELKVRLEKHERTQDDLRALNDKRFNELERGFIEVRTEVKTSASALESVRTVVQELKGLMEHRFDKQGDFYRQQLKEVITEFTTKLEKLESSMRHDIADFLRAKRK